MKKFITIILTITLSLPIFSCVNCFADTSSNKDLLSYLGLLVHFLDWSCGKQDTQNYESENDYVERISSSEETKKCIIKKLNHYEEFFEQYDKNEIGNYVSKKINKRFSRYRSNAIKDRVKNNIDYLNENNLGDFLDKIYVSKSLYRAFPKRFVEVFNEKYGTNVQLDD